MDPSHTLAIEIMELAVEEFPGCVLLWMYSLDIARMASTRVHFEEEEEKDDGNRGPPGWDLWNKAIEALCGMQTCTPSQPNAMLELYRLGVQCFPQKAGEIYLQRAESLVYGNESIQSEIMMEGFGHGSMLKGQDKEELLNVQVEEARKRVAQYLTVLNKYEEDVALAMIEEHVHLPSSFSFQNYLGHDDDDDEKQQNGGNEEQDDKSRVGTVYDWNAIVKALGGIQGRICMGMGMMKTANAFLKYIEGISQHIQYLQKKVGMKHHKDKQTGNDDDDDQWVRGLIQRLDKFIVSTYERAISECPTVEILWIKYLEHLLRVLHGERPLIGGGNEEDNETKELGQILKTPTKTAKLLVQLQNVVSRAVKNCPYSSRLFGYNMQIVLEMARAGKHVLEPDDLMKVVMQAVNGGFLPTMEAHLEVYMEACQALQRWILELVSKGTSFLNYDDSERLDTAKRRNEDGGGTKKKRQRGQDVNVKKYVGSLEDELDQEVDDLVQDLREMYEAAEEFLVKKYPKWTQGRYLLYREWAKSEAYVLSPLYNELNSSDEAIKWFEKMVRAHQPSHPNAWREYISYVIGKAYAKLSDEENEMDEKIVEIPGMAVAKFRFLRNLYQRSLSSTKKVDVENASSDELEYMNALKLLCEEYIQFEKSFGSLRSLDAASKLVTKKLSSFPQRISKGPEIMIPVEGSSDILDTRQEDTIPVEGSNDILDTRQEDVDLKRKRQDEMESLDDEKHFMEVPATKKQKVQSDKIANDKNHEQIQDDKQLLNETIGTVTTQQDENVEQHKQTKTLDEKDGTAETNKPAKEEKKRGPNIWPIKPKPEHTVKVGNMEYPAHPYTIHVSNLASETMDMDLYDLFRPCGPIVHARIFREKVLGRGHPHDHIPKSKCAGLIQFEERDSVEKALELSGEVGIHEKLIEVTRSNQPAVAIVPPGMHRVNPKGQGKNTVRNLKRKERRMKSAATASQHTREGSTSSPKHVKSAPSLPDTNQQHIQQLEQQNKARVDEGKDPGESTNDKSTEKQPYSTATNSSILSFCPRNVRKAPPSGTRRKKKVGI